MTHQFIIGLVIAYTLMGALVFTVVITCLSLIGLVKLANPLQQRTLFKVLIVELVAIGLGFFVGFLKFDPTLVTDSARVEATPVTEKKTITDTRSETLENKVSIEVMSVFNDGGKSREGYIEPPEGYSLDRTRDDRIQKRVSVTLGKRDPTVEIREEGDRIYYRVSTEHGPWFDQWRSLISVDITVHYRMK